jgi:hypothetical protein
MKNCYQSDTFRMQLLLYLTSKAVFCASEHLHFFALGIYAYIISKTQTYSVITLNAVWHFLLTRCYKKNYYENIYARGEIHLLKSHLHIKF